MADPNPILQLGDLLDKREILQVAEAPSPPEDMQNAPENPSVNSPYMPGFPGENDVLKSENGAAYYRDFLYSGFQGNYLKYLDIQIGQKNLTKKEKADLFDSCVALLRTKEDKAAPLNNNCISATKVTLMKFYGMFPADFQLQTCYAKNDVSAGQSCGIPVIKLTNDPLKDCESIYGSAFTKYINKKLNLSVYQLFSLLGVTGLSGPQSDTSSNIHKMYTFVQYFLCSQFGFEWIKEPNERIRKILELKNQKIMKGMQGTSPKMGQYEFKLWNAGEGNLEEFGYEERLRNLVPVLRKVDLGQTHFTIYFYNPFNQSIKVLDSWPDLKLWEKPYGIIWKGLFRDAYHWYLTLE